LSGVKDDAFIVLYSDITSQPSTPVNVLLGLETLKARFTWSVKELYDHYDFDLQLQYELGYGDLREGRLKLRMLYNFKRRLSQYNQEQGKNPVAQAFEDFTDQQMAALKVNTSLQRMDSPQLAKGIITRSRL
jgi:hypothetical protein